MNFIRITPAAAQKLFREGKAFYACPSKLQPTHPFNPAALILSGKEWLERAAWHKDNPKVWKGTAEKTAWCLFVNNWKYYNADDEVGNVPAFYVEK